MYCVKCKSKTENRILGYGYASNGRSYKYAICRECGTKKTQFSGDVVEGEGFEDIDEETEHFAHLAESAYKSVDERENFLSERGITKYKQDTDLSTEEHAVYLADGDVVVSYRGTVPTNVKDLQADARILMGNLKSGERYKRSEKVIEDIKAKYGDDTDITLNGHSLLAASKYHCNR